MCWPFASCLRVGSPYGIRHRWRAVWLSLNQREWQSRCRVDLRQLWFMGRIAPRYVCLPCGFAAFTVFRKRKVRVAFWWCALIIVAVTVPPRLGGESQMWANGIYEALCVLLVFALVKHLPMHTLGAFLLPVVLQHRPLVCVQPNSCSAVGFSL